MPKHASLPRASGCTIERDIAAIDRLVELVTGHRDVVEVLHTDLVEQRRRQSDEVRGLTTELDQHRRARAEKEHALDASRERARQAELGEAEAKLRLETAIETLRRELDIEPAVAEAAPLPGAARRRDARRAGSRART